MDLESPLSRFSIDRVSEYDGKEVRLYGWVHSKRSSGKVKFLILRDGTGFIQAILFKGDVDEETFAKFQDLKQESSVIVTGSIREEKRSIGGYEMGISQIEIIDAGLDEYPIQPKEHGPDFLLDHRHLWLRSKKQNALLRVRSQCIQACREFFDNHGFTLMDSPIFTPNACEGTSTLFEVKYFDEKAYLTQSGQLYGEASALAFGKIYVFGPTFRAEKSKTRKHLTEFWMLEPEIAFCDMNGAIEVAEAQIKHVVASVLKNRKTELETLEQDASKLETVLSQPFPRITYDRAVEILKEKGFEFEWGEDFGAPHETALGEGHSAPLFITHFPTEMKGFYFKKDPTNPKTVLGFDLIAPEGYGEIIGGSEREFDREVLLENIKHHNLDMEDFQWYIDLRRFGSVPHAGYGMGLERVVTWLAGTEHVREAIPYPRMLNRMSP